MGRNRYAAKIDVNQPEIVRQLRKSGHSVITGHDDILVGHEGRTYWFEIKDPEKTVLKDGTWKAGALKDSQIKLLEEWLGQYDAVHSIEQILEIIHGE